jgi:hypothetical protein
MNASESRTADGHLLAARSKVLGFKLDIMSQLPKGQALTLLASHRTKALL